METDKYNIQTVERAFQIIDYVCSNDNPTLSDIADKLGLNKNMTFRLLKSLMNTGYITQHREGFRIHLSPIPKWGSMAETGDRRR